MLRFFSVKRSNYFDIGSFKSNKIGDVVLSSEDINNFFYFCKLVVLNIPPGCWFEFVSVISYFWQFEAASIFLLFVIVFKFYV